MPTNYRESEKQDKRIKEQHGEKYQRKMKKRKLDPEYDEQCKKKAIENKANFYIRKKQEALEKGIVSYIK